MLNDRELAMKVEVKLDDNSDDLHIFPNFDRKMLYKSTFSYWVDKNVPEYVSNVASDKYPDEGTILCAINSGYKTIFCYILPHEIHGMNIADNKLTFASFKLNDF